MKKQCYFCKNRSASIDYTDVETLHRYISPWAKIRPTRDTGACRKHQHQIKLAIKRARYLAILPYTTR